MEYNLLFFDHSFQRCISNMSHVVYPTAVMGYTDPIKALDILVKLHKEERMPAYVMTMRRTDDVHYMVVSSLKPIPSEFWAAIGPGVTPYLIGSSRSAHRAAIRDLASPLDRKEEEEEGDHVQMPC